jgi:hypothetical protein
MSQTDQTLETTVIDEVNKIESELRRLSSSGQDFAEQMIPVFFFVSFLFGFALSATYYWRQKEDTLPLFGTIVFGVLLVLMVLHFIASTGQAIYLERRLRRVRTLASTFGDRANPLYAQQREREPVAKNKQGGQSESMGDRPLERFSNRRNRRHNAPPLRDPSATPKSSNDPFLSGAVSAVTGSTLLGLAAGGSLPGAMLGTALHDSIESGRADAAKKTRHSEYKAEQSEPTSAPSPAPDAADYVPSSNWQDESSASSSSSYSSDSGSSGSSSSDSSGQSD